MMITVVVEVTVVVTIFFMTMVRMSTHIRTKVARMGMGILG